MGAAGPREDRRTCVTHGHSERVAGSRATRAVASAGTEVNYRAGETNRVPKSEQFSRERQ